MAETPRRTAQWARDNCHMLARRELRRLERSGIDSKSIAAWRHVIRICEEAGARQRGVLREIAND